MQKKAKTDGQRAPKDAIQDLAAQADPKGGLTIYDCLISGFKAPEDLKTQTR